MCQYFSSTSEVFILYTAQSNELGTCINVIYKAINVLLRLSYIHAHTNTVTTCMLCLVSVGENTLASYGY